MSQRCERCFLATKHPWDQLCARCEVHNKTIRNIYYFIFPMFIVMVIYIFSVWFIWQYPVVFEHF